MGADVVVGRFALPRRQARPAIGPDHLAAKAEPAIDRAGVDELEQHPVGIAVHDPLHRAVRVVADGVGALLRLRHQFRRVGDELARDGVIGIVGVDQVGHRRSDRDGIAGRHLFERGGARRLQHAGVLHLRDAAQTAFYSLPRKRERGPKLNRLSAHES